MEGKTLRSLLLLVAALSLGTIACGLLTGVDSSGVPNNAEVVEVLVNTSLGPWVRQAAADFNDTEAETAAGDPIFVRVEAIDSGQAVLELAAGRQATLWIPDEQVWVSLLADQGNSSFRLACTSVANSPLVIAMWRPVAESLGWPGLPLGWLDVGSLATDQSAWNYYSGGEYGDTFRLGHTHPGLSGTGASTLLALVQAAQSKTEAVSVEDVQQPIVQASVGAFESGVAWFSSTTEDLGSTMSERGASYLGAAIMYESDVVFYGNGEIVPIYPLEGTFVSAHTACLNQAAGDTAREAATAFRDFLLSEAGQSSAVAFGLRPVDSAIAIGPPLDDSRGVDLDQPATVFAPPNVETIYAVQELWQDARKDVNLVMLLDTSGSMRGTKIETMKAAAIQFVEQMGDDDFITLIAFATEPQLIVNHAQVGPNRAKAINAIENLRARGDTTLFDAIGDGASLIANTTSPQTTNALVVLTDGQDTRSYRYRFDANLIELATADNTTIFTIAYGNDADEGTLSSLATQANGNFYLGDEASIAAIYDEMSAAFGGSVGVGR